MTRLDGIKLSLDEGEDKLLSIARRKTGGRVGWFKILKKSLDARDKGNIRWVYSIAFSAEEPEEPAPCERLASAPRVAVIGSGPAGLFCALRLIERGFAPLIVERGEPVELRRGRCEAFFGGGALDTDSNVQFGEGGAGAFSDGKLNTQTHNGFNSQVLALFARFGAPEEVTYLSKPHIGSDRLYGVLLNIRRYIEQKGGRYLFNTRLEDVSISDGRVDGLLVRDVRTGRLDRLETDVAVLAVGHSARDTFEMLAARGVPMQPREFAVGVRIEHLAEEIGRAQYGAAFSRLPTADYKLVSRAHERTVFTFCMCPGGVVMPAASEQGGVVTNGMSRYVRDGVNSNSALMVQMSFSDFGEGLFDGMNFMRDIERAAFAAGGGNYRAPVQLVGDFLKKRSSSSFGAVAPTYAAGVELCALDGVLPPVCAAALRAALPDMGRRLRGFDCPEALLTAAETRFSSPVRILRGSDMRSSALANLYPCGEGSGYSGGITSSAADGLRAAEKIFDYCKNH